MILFKRSLIFSLLVLLMAACDSEPVIQRLSTPSGLQYVMHQSVSDVKAQIGDILVIELTYGTADSVLFSSINYGRPIYLQVTNPAYRGSIEEGLVMLGAGDSATFFLPADSVYQRIFNQSLPEGIAAGSEMYFSIGVLAIRNEERDLEKYLEKENITAKPRPSGLYILPQIEGKGKMAIPGKKVRVHYTGSLLDGFVFDDSRERNEAFSFELGDDNLIDGWNEGVAKMKEGDRVRLIVPSYLAYGPKGAGNGLIPPYSTLIFDIELLSVEK
jgi:FKBP-type peptidyl-prolyl cis-trans isomerase FkpA